MNFTVDGLFKLLNFLARIGVVIFIVRRYFVSTIQKSIALEKSDLEVLQQKHGHLRESIASIEQQMKQDELVFAQLRSKFEIWNQQVEKHAQKELIECQQRQKKIEMSVHKKTETLQHRQLLQAEVPALLDDVAKSLVQQFAQDKTMHKKYQTNLLNALHE